MTRLVAAGAEAGGFDGFYIAAKTGTNDSSTSGTYNDSKNSKNSIFVGGELGCNWSIPGNTVIGADVRGDGHGSSVTEKDVGAGDVSFLMR